MAYPKIEGERLDIVLQRLREKGDSSALPATDAFEALINRPGDKPMAEGSMESLLIDFIMPIIKDPGIFQENRTIMLLKHLRHQMVPQWKESGETTDGVLQALDDEIARYIDLRERRHGGIPA